MKSILILKKLEYEGIFTCCQLHYSVFSIGKRYTDTLGISSSFSSATSNPIKYVS